MNGIPVQEFHLSLKNAPISNENKQLLSYLGYSPNVDCIRSVKDWCDFVRRVTFHTCNTTKDFEACILPTYSALHKHALRAYGYCLVYLAQLVVL